MEGLSLDNMLNADEVAELFSGKQETQEVNNDNTDTSENKEDTAEVDFSDLLGSQPESVGSEEDTEGNREAPDSKNDIGAPNKNLFSSIAKALKDEGVFPDLSDDTLNSIKDAEAFRKLFDDQVANSLSERQKRIETALNGGATSDEVRSYQNDLNIMEFLQAQDTLSRLESESDDGETLRKQMMYQDFINRGFSDERAKKMVMKSINDGTDMEDAKEAMASCKDFYKRRLDDYQRFVTERQRTQKEQEEQQYNNLKKQILDTENFFDGVKVDKNTRQRAYDAITKPVYKDEAGNYLTALQKYQRENPADFMKNVAMLYALTDSFKNVEKLTKSKVKAGMKKGFAELESVLNNTRRNSDGTLNFANGEPDMEERENWTLAI